MTRACLTICLVVLPLSASAEIKLKDGDRVVFFGDTLVESPMFSLNVETFIRVRYPQLRVRFFNSGQHNQTAADGLRRLERELVPLEPDVVVVCFGLYDPDRRPLDDKRLADFQSTYASMIASIRKLKARVVVVTPPEPLAKGLAQIDVPDYDKVIGRYAAVIREIATSEDIPVVDWHSRSTTLNAQLKSGGPSRGSELTPPPLSHAAAASDLLRLWGAEPLDVRIDLDWATAQARISHGRVEVVERTARSLVLDIHDMPLPWALAGVRTWELRSTRWPGEELCRYHLHVDHLPETGIHLDWRSKHFPIGPEAASEEGMSILHLQPIQLSRALRELKVYIRDKHRWRWKLSSTREPEEPELAQAFAAYLDSLKLYEEGTANIVMRLPKTFDVRMRFEVTADDADESEQDGSNKAASPPR